MVARAAVAIDKKHVVAFTPPSGRKPEDVQDRSHILALALRLHEHVVILAIHILAARFGLRNGARGFVPPLRVKAALVGNSARLRILLVVDVEVKVGHVLRPVIGQRDPRSISKWHFEVAVHGAILHGDRQGPPGLVFLSAMPPGTSSYSNPVPKKSPIGTSTLGSVSPSQYMRSTSSRK